ncbi:MAG: aldo/keto reductase, partial [Anaerolineae bacterium]|nr:aldo/keto reductase [Anaerolineae bacterium]
EMLKQRGRIRAYGISTDSLAVLKRFNANGTCSVVQVDYSMLNRAPEDEFLPYCQEHGIAVMVRGPLRRGLLSGKYDLDSVFTDDVRASWNKGEAGRTQYEAEIAKVAALKSRFAPGEAMVNAAIRYVISHPAHPVAIPGAKSPAQAAMNAAVGERLFSAEELAEVRRLLE